VSKKDGSFTHRPKRKVEKKSKGKKKKGEKTKKVKTEKVKGEVKTEEGAAAVVDATNDTVKEEVKYVPPAAPVPMRAPPVPVPQNAAPIPANRILFVENLPEKCTNAMLSMLFQQYLGFKEARLVNGKPGIAFVEFMDATQSMTAKQALHNFKITATNNMKVTYARQ
jgi:hypothetical protein